MTMETIFLKEIDRPIEGVIKADDDDSLRIEIEEYVLTNEVAKRLEHFLNAYNDYQGANGVWVSGFFGSGKSHLLKMLAFLLENRSVEDISVLDSFLSKCQDDELLKGNLKRAISIPSQSILFNIDQKADVISKTQIDALLAVFMKVFDDVCGYYGKQGHIAQFERDLDSRHQYQDFKQVYQQVAGRTWEIGREQALLESQNIATAYAQVTGSDASIAKGILDKYRSEYKVSIEDFAEQVNAYLKGREPNFRLNFFVDEVGQYISENIKLMTNLQTIAESLATKCRGRAWIIVTAQEDMEMVIGERSQQQSNDFSKIQARFANRMKLTSQDVEEVIQKRLLMKNENGCFQLSELYYQQANNFKTLFDFADGSRTYRNFKDKEHFIQSYPFIPYQFALFQSAIQNLSEHNAFEGKYSSVGERSMLGVFQQVAIQIRHHDIGQLATFDLMYEGIRSALKGSIQRSIRQAEKHLDNLFAIQLLKALFLVKYVKDFKATLRNLCVLMLDRFDRDVAQLVQQVEEGLGLLEQQTYIQRHGSLYEYLTDEEKDIEEDIKNTVVEIVKVRDEINKLVFNEILKTNKIRSESNGQDDSFFKKVDDQIYSRSSELVINIISPLNDNVDNETNLRMQSMGKDELLVILPSDDRLMRDLLMYKRTEKYTSQNVTIAQKDSVTSLLKEKGYQNTQRYIEITQRLQTLLGQATLIIEGSDLEISGEDAQTRIIKGFQQLILKVYPHRRMLRGMSYKVEDIEKALNQSKGLFPDSLSEAEQEVLSFAQSNRNSGLRTTIKSLLEKFERKPYGWDYYAILYILASLLGRGKLECRLDSNLLAGDELLKSLTNSREHSNVILETQIEFTASQVRSLKEFYADFFDEPALTMEAKGLGLKTGEAFAQLIKELETIALRNSNYPFLGILQNAIHTLQSLKGKPYAWYLTDLLGQEDDLFDLKEKVSDPIRLFINGSQRDIFEPAQVFLQKQEANFTYVLGEEPASLRLLLQDPQCYKGDRLQQIKILMDGLATKISEQVRQEITSGQEQLESLKNGLLGMAEYERLTMEQQEQIIEPFESVSKKIATEKLIAVIRETVRGFKDHQYSSLLAQLTDWARPKSESGEINPQLTAKIEYISRQQIQVSFDKPYLGDREDVDRYLEAMRAALLTEIQQGKRIQV